MNQATILYKFDQLVRSGIVQYDETQKIIPLVDGELKFQFVLTSALLKKPVFQVPQLQPEDNQSQQQIRDGNHSFAAFLDSEGDKETNVPFHWYHHRFQQQDMNSFRLTEIYSGMLEQATRVGDGRSEHAGTTIPGAATPHNMILTKRWMIVLPRRRAGINKEAGANAMGMLGYIAVATHNELDSWKRLGLKETLRELGVPKE